MEEALKLALEALENHEGNYKLGNAGFDRWDKAVTAIKEALAQPAQKPYEISTDELIYMTGVYDGKKKRPWIELTFAEICECENDSLLKFARAIEAALRSKNHD